MQAIILAGGFGTRLKSMVNNVPKPMAPVNGRPFLAWLLEYMAGQGVREVVLCLHHMPELIQARFGESFHGIKLHYSIEDKPLGTGGAIKQALGILQPSKPVFALNGDSLVQVNYAQMMTEHMASGRKITIATRQVPNCQRYSELTISDGMVEHYELLGDAHAGHISTGFYVISPDLFSDAFLPTALAEPSFTGLSEGLGEGGFSFERDFLSQHTPELKPTSYDGVEYFIDIGVPADYTRGQTEIPQQLTRALAA